MSNSKQTFFNLKGKSEDGFSGFQELSNEILQYIDIIEKPMEILEAGAKEFVEDLQKLPKPISKIKKAGYTHLINSFLYRKKKEEIEVGWGKYYGPMVEYGTTKMDAREHLNPLWEKNKEKYYYTMFRKMRVDPFFLY